MSSDLETSDRFMGLSGATAEMSIPPLRLFSCRVCAVRQLKGPSGDLSFSFSSPPFKAFRVRSRSASAEVLLHSGIGEALPLSLESVNARFVGLFGDVRRRVKPWDCVVLRSAGRGKREAEADLFDRGVPMLVKCRVLSDIVFLEGDNGDGEKGVFPGPGDLKNCC